MYLTLCDPMDLLKPARLLCPWDYPGIKIKEELKKLTDFPAKITSKMVSQYVR